jgi:transcriptional regulator with XRE-family HTH domain
MEYSEIQHVLKQNLAIARQVRKLTQEELAIMSGVSRTTIIQLEDGKGDPKLTTIVDLADALGISPVLLLIGKEEMLAILAVAQNPPNAATAAEAQLETMSQLLQAGLGRSSRARAAMPGPVNGAAIGAAVGSMLLPGMGTAIGAMLGSFLERKAKVPSEREILSCAIREISKIESGSMLQAFEILRLSVEGISNKQIARDKGKTIDEVEDALSVARARLRIWEKESGKKVVH